MKTSIDLNATLWRRFRAACVERGVAAGKIIEALIAEKLEKWQKENK